MAPGSDTWPLTWADDDHLYTAYGDGWGFEPRIEKKLSFGLARLEGYPPDIRGVNGPLGRLKSRGRVPAGAKRAGCSWSTGRCTCFCATPIARGRYNRVVWTSDRGTTWTTPGRGTNSFTSSHTTMPAPIILRTGSFLMRVPKDRIRERRAYEFFVKRDEQDRPTWTRQIERRGGVFEHAGRCYRSGISYNAGLGRYVWSQIIPSGEVKFTGGKGDVRFEGGFGVYDAPDLGPWTTVFHAEKWDVGPGETSSFPPKWMSDDGRIVHLVFSGDDYFSVRRATLVRAQHRRR